MIQIFFIFHFFKLSLMFHSYLAGRLKEIDHKKNQVFSCVLSLMIMG